MHEVSCELLKRHLCACSRVKYDPKTTKRAEIKSTEMVKRADTDGKMTGRRKSGVIDFPPCAIHNALQYDIHNTYGYGEEKATFIVNALLEINPTERPFLISCQPVGADTTVQLSFSWSDAAALDADPDAAADAPLDRALLSPRSAQLRALTKCRGRPSNTFEACVTIAPSGKEYFACAAGSTVSSELNLELDTNGNRKLLSVWRMVVGEANSTAPLEVSQPRQPLTKPCTVEVGLELEGLLVMPCTSDRPVSVQLGLRPTFAVQDSLDTVAIGWPPLASTLRTTRIRCQCIGFGGGNVNLGRARASEPCILPFNGKGHVQPFKQWFESFCDLARNARLHSVRSAKRARRHERRANSTARAFTTVTPVKSTTIGPGTTHGLSRVPSATRTGRPLRHAERPMAQATAVRVSKQAVATNKVTYDRRFPPDPYSCERHTVRYVTPNRPEKAPTVWLRETDRLLRHAEPSPAQAMAAWVRDKLARKVGICSRASSSIKGSVTAAGQSTQRAKRHREQDAGVAQEFTHDALVGPGGRAFVRGSAYRERGFERKLRVVSQSWNSRNGMRWTHGLFQTSSRIESNYWELCPTAASKPGSTTRVTQQRECRRSSRGGMLERKEL
ncbi:hypothetical protein AURDEDRAFT_131908, partial [Auricularia subglabra TFB-10046 SS5]